MYFNLGDYHDPIHADRLAIIDCLDWEKPREVTHGEVDRLAKSVARGLLKRGLKRGDAVAILSNNRTEFLASYFGIMRAGLVAVPVNHKFPRDTIQFVLTDSATKLALCDRERRALLPAGISTVEFATPEWDALLDPGEFESVRPTPDETAMVLYTSGSTGRPKGVPLSHQGHLWAVESRLKARPSFVEERLVVAAPLFHMNALGTSKFIFASHASMVLLPQFDARRYIEAIGRFRVTWLTSVPTMLAMVVREKETLAKTDLSSVGFVRMGSAPASAKLLEDVKHWFPKAVLSNSYGTTEAGPVVFGPTQGRAITGLSLGWPLPGVEVRLVGKDGKDANEGVLWQRTPANMKGYLNLPAKTREVLTPEGWYISGDVFRRGADGAYTFVGRDDDMFNCGGENIYPGEVEQMLEKHPDILQACVVPVPDEIKGEKPVAFVVLKAGAKLSEDEVKQYSLANAPAYQHPRRVTFMKELPLATTNKVDRKVLGKLALEQLQQTASLD